MSKEELKLRVGLFALAFTFAAIFDLAPGGLVAVGALISAIFFFFAAWVPWDTEK